MSQLGAVNSVIRWTLQKIHVGLRLRCMRSVALSLANQPVQLQQFGQPFVVPTIKLWGYKGPYEVVVACVTPDGKAHPHGLEGQHCREGLCVFRGGGKDLLSDYYQNKMYKGYNTTGFGYRTNEEYRRMNRRITWDLLKIMLKDLSSFYFTYTTVEIPNLRVKPSADFHVREALSRKERLPKSICFYSYSPPGDPFSCGFSHKNDPVDLSSVRLAFSVTLLCGTKKEYHAVTAFKPKVCDVIYDYTPRILSLSTEEASQDGGHVVKLEVTRDDVIVEFFDQAGWRVQVDIGNIEGGGPVDLYQEKTIDGPYVAELEVEVPEYPKDIIKSQEVFIRLTTLDGKVFSPPQTFAFLPSVKRRLVKEEQEKRKDYLSLAMEKVEEKKQEDYLTRLKKETEHLPRKRSVLRPVKREARSTPGPVRGMEETLDTITVTTVDAEAHKAAARKKMLEMMKGRKL